MVKITRLNYITPTPEFLHDCLDVLITLQDDEALEEEFCYLVQLTTPQCLINKMNQRKMKFIEPDYPSIIVVALTPPIINAAIKKYVESEKNLYWIKLYHLIQDLTLEEIDSIFYRKELKNIADLTKKPKSTDFDDEKSFE
jgi:hypothetical protein